MQDFLFSEKLSDRCIAYFKHVYGISLTIDESQDFLGSLSDFYLAISITGRAPPIASALEEHVYDSLIT
jgi:hypothetical protein